MKCLNRFSKFYVLLVIFGIFACAGTHKLNKHGLEEVIDRTFKAGTVKIPCGSLKRLPSTSIFDSISTKGHQLTILENIPIDETLKILAENYGLKVSYNEKMERKSKWECWELVNELDELGSDIIDIEYTISSLTAPPLPIKIKVGYRILVKSDGIILVEHEGEVASFKYSFLKGERYSEHDVFEKIKMHAQDIPMALQKDIENTKHKI